VQFIAKLNREFIKAEVKETGRKALSEPFSG
jgi:hypothetical protein